METQLKDARCNWWVRGVTWVEEHRTGRVMIEILGEKSRSVSEGQDQSGRSAGQALILHHYQALSVRFPQEGW
jgi:hypothetical protein